MAHLPDHFAPNIATLFDVDEHGQAPRIDATPQELARYQALGDTQEIIDRGIDYRRDDMTLYRAHMMLLNDPHVLEVVNEDFTDYREHINNVVALANENNVPVRRADLVFMPIHIYHTDAQAAGACGGDG